MFNKNAGKQSPVAPAREGRVTASIFKDVCRSKRVRCTTLFNKIMSLRPLNVPAVLYGVANEPVAKERLLEHLQTTHTNARIEACGLMVHPNYPLLGCSPDGIFLCDCHDPALVEVSLQLERLQSPRFGSRRSEEEGVLPYSQWDVERKPCLLLPGASSASSKPGQHKKNATSTFMSRAAGTW